MDLELTAEVVSAYVSNNPVPASELATLIATVAESISRLSGSTPTEHDKPVPAVPIKKSITNDYLISLEDGKKFKSLKRVLATRYGLTPDEYRAKWVCLPTIRWLPQATRPRVPNSPSRWA